MELDGLFTIKKKGKLIINNELYRIWDIKLDGMTCSVTELKPLQKTRGHSHALHEIYFFVEGKGQMIIGRKKLSVVKGTVTIVPKGKFHQVINEKRNNLTFATVFEKDRFRVKKKY